MNVKWLFSLIKHYAFLLIYLSTIGVGQRVQIEGEAEYNFSDNETLIEAKSLCYNMALRNAVESYQVFVSSMSDVQNMQLRNDIIQTLSTGYIENLTVVSEKIDKNNNTIYYKLKAYIQPEPFKNALKQEVKRRSNFAKPSAVIEGKYLTILNIVERDGKITVVFKIKIGYGRYFYDVCQSKLDNFSLADNQCIDNVKIDFYDVDGIPIGGNNKKTERGLEPEEIRSINFVKPRSAKTYRVWVTK